MNQTTQKQFNQILRQQGIEAGIKPVEDIPNEKCRLDEVERLGVLEKDFSAESNYNALTQLATITTGSQIGLINILGSNIQKCKMDFGFSPDQSAIAQELPREISVCQYSLLIPKEPLIIEDMFLDERTKNFQKIEAYSGLRFYAGSPLVTSKGYSIGTLCVLGMEPRKINHDQIEGLRLLADLVVSSIENDFLKKQDNRKKQVSFFNEGESMVKYFSTSSIMFADFVGFTKLVEKLEAGDLIETLNIFFKGFDRLAKKHNIRKVKTIGDCYMCVSGIPKQEKEHALNMCMFALDILKFVEGINIQHEVLEKPVWKIRIGIHSGPLIANFQTGAFDIWGDSVNIAARMESSGQAGKVHISEKTADYIDSEFSLKERGEVELKNKGFFRTFFLN
ncbi:MAG: hypothetical protein CMI23_10660 [Opitutae bacterium]|nr:hypothetical protein [Opitutae bacterium]